MSELLQNACEQALLLLERERFAGDSEATVVRAVLRSALVSQEPVSVNAVLSEGHAVNEISVRFEREQVEVTRDGTLPPFEPDYQRVFIPGLTTVYVTVDGEELPPMTPEQYSTWAALSGGPR